MTVLEPDACAQAPARLQRVQTEDGLVVYRSRLLAALDVPHAFTTRLDAVTELDLGRLGAEAHARLTRAAGLPGARLLFVRQIHGDGVLELGPGAEPAAEACADALVSTRADALVGVHVADCVPVLLARRDGRRVAAVHAGWRGLLAGVIARALERLGPGACVAAVGPCISRAHFEVGPEVLEAFEEAGFEAVIERRAAPLRARIDLRALAVRQLQEGGVEALELSDRCTYADEDELYSHRRDVTHGGRPRTGRLGALVAAARPSRP